MHTLGDMAKALNRAPVYLAGLQKRFELPVFEGAAYSDDAGGNQTRAIRLRPDYGATRGRSQMSPSQRSYASNRRR